MLTCNCLIITINRWSKVTRAIWKSNFVFLTKWNTFITFDDHYESSNKDVKKSKQVGSDTARKFSIMYNIFSFIKTISHQDGFHYEKKKLEFDVFYQFERFILDTVLEKNFFSMGNIKCILREK